MHIRAICGSFRRRVWHPAIPTPPSVNPPTEFTEFTEVSGVGYSPTDFTEFTEVSSVGFSHRIHRIHRNDCRRIFSHRFRRFSQIFRLRFCLLICAHPCLSVGGTSLPECSVCSAYSVGHSLCLLCWCCRGSCTSVVVFSHGFHGFPQMVRLRYWRRGYGRMPYPPTKTPTDLTDLHRLGANNAT